MSVRMCRWIGPDTDGWCADPDVDLYRMVVLNIEIEYCARHAKEQLAKGHIIKVEK